MPDTPPEVADAPALPDAKLLLDAARQRKAEARALEQLAKAGDQPAALRRGRSALDKAAAGAATAASVAQLCEGIDTWLAHEEATRRPRLASALRDACAAASIDLVVLTRDPLELRLPPLGVSVDVARDRADITFGKQVLTSCGAQADAVIAARQQALDQLQQIPWDPAALHGSLRRAWQRLGAADWQELTQVLPLLAFELQDARFLRDPVSAHYRPYSRAQLAWDLWRLRRDRALTSDGWRLTLGSATGGSTRDKKRVFWIEDDQGRGQYYLTLRFVRDGSDG